jgi:hypothetical protein
MSAVHKYSQGVSKFDDRIHTAYSADRVIRLWPVVTIYLAMSMSGTNA